MIIAVMAFDAPTPLRSAGKKVIMLRYLPAIINFYAVITYIYTEKLCFLSIT
jgi:hypothetical protein